MQSIVNQGKMAGRRLGFWVVGVAGFTMGAVLLAQGLWAEDAGPAGRAVRLSSVDGQVKISQNSQVLAESAVANAPLFEGTQVVTGDDGRAEIQYEDGSLARISPNSSLTLKVLKGSGATGEAVLVLDAGLGYFELEGGAQNGTMRVRFGNSVVTSSGPAIVRINLDSLPGELAVFSGNAHLERGTAVALDVHGGESVSLSGSDASQYNLAEQIEPDSWDTWNSDRDQALEGQSTARTATTNGFGDNGNPAWNDLDANGSWYNVPGQGNVWSPYEAADASWDPYGDGNWMYQPAYGYIWVSGSPWGYLPYHCGMWNWYESFGWGWEPGLGGCRPWWGGGFYGGPFIGSRFGGYRPPMRPRRPIPSVNGRHPVYPMVAVSRKFPSGSSPLPSRDKSTVVEIAGHTVQAQHPISPRPQYSRAGVAGGGHPGSQGTYVTHGATPMSGGTRPGTPPATHNASSVASHPAPASHPASAPASHPSGGGGGGGGHPSGGGGAHH
jgi:FecR protein